MARESLGHDARLTLVTADAATWILRQPKFSFDLIFADAMPGKYELLDEALALVKSGGFYPSSAECPAFMPWMDSAMT